MSSGKSGLILFLKGEALPEGGWIGGQATPFLLSLVTVVYGVGTALSANQWGRLADRIGHRNVWILGSLGFFTHISFFFINQHNYAWLGLINATLFGVLFAGQPVAIQNLALAMAPKERREFYISIFQAVIALAAALGPLAGGVLADHFRTVEGLMLPSGQPVAYIHIILAVSFVGMLATLPLMMWVPDPKGIPVRPWFGRLLSGDLWRVAWNISVLGTASGVSSRVRALRRIGGRDGNLMLPEIQVALDDSDLSIRREALLALGRLGTPEADDLLLWYLHEPDVTMRAHSVEAIGQPSGTGRAVLLRQALRDPDSRVRLAAVEALGRAGGAEATSELTRLLDDERDGEVLISVALVMSRLKEFGAVRQMLDLALYCPNATVRMQMLVALADLLGESGGFHKLWREDRHWRGTAFAKLARKLRKQMRVLAHGHITSQPARSRAQRQRLIQAGDQEIEHFLEEVQEERWSAALDRLCRLALQLIVLRYRYEGDERRAMEFLSAVAPGEAQRYWLVTYLRHARSRGDVSEASWDGLTLLALYIMVHGQPAM